MSLHMLAPVEVGPVSYSASEDGTNLDPIDTGYQAAGNDLIIEPELRHEEGSHYELKLKAKAGLLSLTLIEEEIDISGLCSDESDKIAGLSKGAFAGAMIGAFAGAAILGGGAVMWKRRRGTSVVTMQPRGTIPT